MKSIKSVITATLLLAFSTLISADPTTQLADLGKSAFPEWLSNPIVIEQVKVQNTKHADLSEADIISLDKQWRAETSASDQPMIKTILGNELSVYLNQVKEKSAGLYTEIFVMDNKGLNVGQSDTTSDYWQGDEAKWQKTYLMGADSIHVGEIEMDESSQQFQSQVSMPVVNSSGEVIGAVTVGINVDAL